VRVPRNEKRARIVVTHVVGAEREGDNVCLRELRRSRIAGVKRYLLERGRGEGDLFAVGRERDAVCERDAESNKRVIDAWVTAVVVKKRDVRKPAQGEREHGFGEWKYVSEHGQSARHEMVVADVERRRRRECEGIGRNEEGVGDRAHPACHGGIGGVKHKLLNDGSFSCVVDDEEWGGFAGERGPDVQPERMEIVPGRVALEHEALWATTSASHVNPQRTVGVGVLHWAHDGVPVQPAWIAAQNQVSLRELFVSVEEVPKHDVLAEPHVLLLDDTALGIEVATMVVADWVGWECEHVYGEAEVTPEKDSLNGYDLKKRKKKKRKI
jgi:hypothetical protein